MNEDPARSRGTKRKASDTGLHTPKRIRALDQDVVNKIAAGEIIVAPMHALKEMIENSIDAGATWLEIVIKDGGLKLLQISDNGHGINVDDLPILCERFTTSKLRSFEDLSAISTYGFRGEALASISHIANLKITTRTAQSSCAFQAHFRDGKLVSPRSGGDLKPRPIAGRRGTQITVEDLFYNVPQRRKAFRSSSEEYAKILDVVGRYSVHCEGVAVSCKKHGENTMGLSVPSASSKSERIGIVYGQGLSKNLTPFKTDDARFAVSVSGFASTLNHHGKKTIFLLFINNRSVESLSLKASVQRLYSAFLPKGSHPFVYLSIKIAAERVDVNVHPTKREVGFLNEAEIIELVCGSIRSELVNIDASRVFLTQSLLTSAFESDQASDNKQQERPQKLSTAATKSVQHAVRTDPRVRKITSMLEPISGEASDELRYVEIDKKHMQIRLDSVKELRAAVREQASQELLETFATSTWVGIVDWTRRIFAMQSGAKLLLVDYGLVSNEFFYQLGLTDFGNFGSIVFTTPLSIRGLVQHAVHLEEAENPDLDLQTAPDMVMNQLVERREMLLEYFNMKVSPDGRLHSIPLLLKGYTPCLGKLPRFLLRLGPCVNWNQEKECFRSFLSELASFYSPEQKPNWPADKADSNQESQENEEMLVRRDKLARSLEYVLFPAFRLRLLPTTGMLTGMLEVANLKGLYRIFERC